MDIGPKVFDGEAGSDGNSYACEEGVGGCDDACAMVEGHGRVPAVFARNGVEGWGEVRAQEPDAVDEEGTTLGKTGGSGRVDETVGLSAFHAVAEGVRGHYRLARSNLRFESVVKGDNCHSGCFNVLLTCGDAGLTTGVGVYDEDLTFTHCETVHESFSFEIVIDECRTGANGQRRKHDHEELCRVMQVHGD